MQTYGLEIHTHLNLPYVMLETSNIGGVMQSMSVNYMCANANVRLANQDLIPRWLNLISGA